MALNVIGAGFGRTGTLSLKAALERLGTGRCYHMTELMDRPGDVDHWRRAAKGREVDWDKLFAAYGAAVDFPAYRFWREIAAHYPQAKVILTVRDEERWYESTKATVFQAAPDLWGKLEIGARWPFMRSQRQLLAAFMLADRLIWQEIFSGRFQDRAHALAVFRRHNAEVQAALPPERLLVFDVAQGWEPLCAFLGVPVPDEPFPRLNDRTAFSALKKRITSAPVAGRLPTAAVVAEAAPPAGSAQNREREREPA